MAATQEPASPWQIPWLETLIRDAAFALRTFRRNLVFSVTAIATLAIGTGASTAVFSVLNAVLLKPFGVPDPDRVVILGWLSPEGLAAGGSPETFDFFAEQSELLEHSAAFRPALRNYMGGDFPRQIMAAEVSDGFFRTFGVPIAAGRSFSAEETAPGGPKVAVISQSFRDRLFAGETDVLGQHIELGGTSYEVIGVAGGRFDLGQLREFRVPPVAYLPLEIEPSPTGRTAFVNMFRVAARLRAGASLEQTKERLQSSAVRFRERFADARVLPERLTFGAELLTDYVIDAGTRRTLWILAGAVALVLLIACANAANLLLVRANSRARETAVRVAMGARSGRLIRQSLTESVLLFLIAGALGLALGIAGIRGLLRVSTSGLPRVGEAGALVVLDWRVLAFALFASLATGVVFGLLPALAASRVDVSSFLKDSGRDGRRGPARARKLLVAGEIGLAVVLLIGAGLLIRTQIAILAVEPGFDARNTLLMMTTLDESNISPLPQVQRTLDELRALPGVEAAALTCNPCLPLQFGLTRAWWFPERAQPEPGRGPASRWVAATDDYFDVFGISLLAGRTFGPEDVAASPPVMLINRKMADTFFRDGDAIGRRLTIAGGPRLEQQPPREIIGIVDDVPDGDLRRPVTPRMYVPLAQLPERTLAELLASTATHWGLRTAGNPYDYQQQAEEILVKAMGAPIARVQSGEDYVKGSLASQRFNLLLMSVFAGAAVVLAAVGVFGTIAYAVNQRRHEFGIRLAFGADPANLARRALSEGFVMALAGASAGILASYWLVRILANRLYEVEPRDPVVFAIVPTVAVLIGVLASWIPARRASRLDPLQALRYE